MSGTTASIKTAWHATTSTSALEQVTSSTKGLTNQEAAERLARLGPNRLPSRQARSAIARLAGQFNNVLIHVLLASAAITAALGQCSMALSSASDRCGNLVAEVTYAATLKS